eukprot:scaffold335473_cov41-Prasinocladus_malaysianus.AAC.1
MPFDCQSGKLVWLQCPAIIMCTAGAGKISCEDLSHRPFPGLVLRSLHESISNISASIPVGPVMGPPAHLNDQVLLKTRQTNR